MLNNPQTESEAEEQSFADILNEFENTNRAGRPGRTTQGKGRRRGKSAPKASRQGTVVGLSGDFVLIDYGAKSEGVLPKADLMDEDGNLTVEIGEAIDIAITGYNSEGLATLSHIVGPRPRDWEDLQQAFDHGSIIAGRVTGTVKGGFTVDVGARAFLPASRSGVRDAVEMEKLVGQEIRCRVIKLDVADEDVVVDRRSVMEEEAEQLRQATLSSLEEGAVVRGTVRSLAGYGAFVDIGGVTGLLHVSDISWSRVTDPATELRVGDELELKVLKVDKDAGKISLGLKQMSRDPFETAVEKLSPGDRVTGEVTRLADFGAFVEVLPGVEGLIHVSEMSWTRRVQRPSEVLKVGERVEAVVLKVEPESARLSLGLKQVLGNPWDTIRERYPSGKVVEGKVTRIAKFGAFVELEEGIDGLVHVSELTSEKRVETPSEVVKVGQAVRAVILSADPEGKRVKLSMKQLEPTAADQFTQEVAVGDRVTGRVVSVRGNEVRVQLGEGVEAVCRLDQEGSSSGNSPVAGASLAEQLAAAWKGAAVTGVQSGTMEPYSEGQLRTFVIKALDPGNRKIDLSPA